MRPITDDALFLEKSRATLSEMLEKLRGLPSLPLNQLTPEKTLVVSIDINNGFAKAGALYSDRTEALIPATAALFNHCAAAGYGLLAYSDCHTEASPELGSYPVHCMEGSREAELVDELHCLKETLYPKNSTNGLFVHQPDLDRYETIIVTGCCTDICIYQYAVTLKALCNQQNRTNRVIVPVSLVDTYDAPWHNADLMGLVMLDSMASNGVELVADLTF